MMPELTSPTHLLTGQLSMWSMSVNGGKISDHKPIKERIDKRGRSVSRETPQMLKSYNLSRSMQSFRESK